MADIKTITVDGMIYNVKDASVYPVLTGTSDPTVSTVGKVGQIYINRNINGHTFICYSAAGSLYSWRDLNEASTLLNRTNSVNAEDTNYTTLMARGESLNSADTTPAVNGAIAWKYE